MTAHIRIQQLPNAAGLPLPNYATEGAAGADLHAAEAVVLGPGERGLVPTGIMLELPPDVEAQVRPRSGLALRSGVTVLNAPGTIDSDYRGEVGVLLVNLGDEPVYLRRGERIAQLVLAPVLRAVWVDGTARAPTARGAGGWGSTGQ
jgi:dUTP pyrophosphatase